MDQIEQTTQMNDKTKINTSDEKVNNIDVINRTKRLEKAKEMKKKYSQIAENKMNGKTGNISNGNTRNIKNAQGWIKLIKTQKRMIKLK